MKGPSYGLSKGFSTPQYAQNMRACIQIFRHENLLLAYEFERTRLQESHLSSISLKKSSVHIGDFDSSKNSTGNLIVLP